MNTPEHWEQVRRTHQAIRRADALYLLRYGARVFSNKLIGTAHRLSLPDLKAIEESANAMFTRLAKELSPEEIAKGMERVIADKGEAETEEMQEIPTPYASSGLGAWSPYVTRAATSSYGRYTPPFVRSPELEELKKE